MRLTLPFVLAGLAVAAAPAAGQSTDDQRIVARDMIRSARERAYQGRNNGPEQTERFSRKVKIGRDGRVSLANIAGEIVITAGSGDEVSIEAVKRTRGDRNELANVQIVVDERSGRVDIRTEGDQNRFNRNRRGDGVSVDYTLSVPAGASVDVHSVSGSIKVTGVHGSLRAETVSGNVTTNDTPRLENAKSVSGDISLTGAASDGELTASSVSGNVTARGLKARGLDLGSVSGDIIVTDVTCDRLGVKSISGNVEYSGGIARTGRYEFNSHSGSVRLMLANPAGFELSASSFSGSIRSDLPLTIGGDSSVRDGSSRRSRESGPHNMRATFGDGSATLTIRTFSGDVVIGKR
jgi:putative adhesin